VTDRLDRLWAGWRSDYLTTLTGDASRLRPDETGSLFERLLALGDDDEALVVVRGTACSVILNAYPYSSGHLMAVPNRAVEDIGSLTDDEYDELWRLVRDGVAAVRSAYGCGGVNVGANIGAAGGAGIPDHLHVHVVPRWTGDTNFMTTVAGVRVLPEALEVTLQRVRAAWP